MITVIRPKQLGSGIKKYKVYANNHLICEIAEEEKLELSLNPGTYTISAKVLWFKSKELKMDLKKGDKLIIKSNKYVLWLPILPAIVYGVIVAFGFNPENTFYSYSIIMLLLIIALNLPIVRRNYLKITKE
ncbi:hypothetical protein [Robertkochia sediminum]|uniref:hypothetical protein n=1 Tax=Robertkochia sediminum TaxID=2785326 RepID=UPI001931E23D|nr:hypothetical protein [Robertkochia sediminum]MBL7471195.1 hypothetical protein [Robertkochia sediminum]